MKSTVFLLILVVATTAKNLGWRDLSKIIPMNYQPPFLQQGISNSEGARIVGGEVATPHSFPYQAALYIPYFGAGVLFCGGSLIDSQWILTAAHCLTSANGSITIKLGAQNIRSNESSQVRLKSSDLHIYPLWDSKTAHNDLALVKLPQKVEYNSNIQAVRLPSKSELQTTYAKNDSIITGWGFTSDNSITVSAVLNFVTVPVMSNYDCSLIKQNIVDSQLCTSGNDKKGSCFGDNGGPLVVTESDGVKTQIGIVSRGNSLCEMGRPDVFTRVTSFVDWISNTTGIAIRN